MRFHPCPPYLQASGTSHQNWRSYGDDKLFPIVSLWNLVVAIATKVFIGFSWKAYAINSPPGMLQIRNDWDQQADPWTEMDRCVSLLVLQDCIWSSGSTTPRLRWPRWLSWMRRPTGDQEVTGSTPVEVGNILLWRLIMKYFLQSFSPFRWFKKGSCQFLAKECTQYWLTA